VDKQEKAGGAPEIGGKAWGGWLSALPFCLAMIGLLWPFAVVYLWAPPKTVFLVPVIVWSCSIMAGLGNILACTIFHFPLKGRRLVYAGVICSAVFVVCVLLIPVWNRLAGGCPTCR